MDVPFTHSSTNDSSALMSAVVTLYLGGDEQNLPWSQAPWVVELVHLGQRPPGAGRPELLGSDEVDGVTRLDHAHPSRSGGTRRRILSPGRKIDLFECQRDLCTSGFAAFGKQRKFLVEAFDNGPRAAVLGLRRPTECAPLESDVGRPVVGAGVALSRRRLGELEQLVCDC